MSEPNDEPTPADEPAPELEPTATPETEKTQEPDPPEDEAPKTFTQEELDAAIGKRLAREQRKWEREQAHKAAERQPTPETGEPLQIGDFDTPEAYAEALADRKAEEKLATRERNRQQEQVLDAYYEREDEARLKYDDFAQVALNDRLPVTPVMAEAIKLSETGPEVLYHLGQNPDEAKRISRLPEILQVKEIGKIEAALASNPPVKKTSTAPAPISPVSARATSAPAYDTTDPRSTKTMTTSEWIAAEEKRMRKNFEAAR